MSRGRARTPRIPRRVRAGAVRAETGVLTCLVLATPPGEWVAIDLASGAFARLRRPPGEPDGDGAARPLDVVEVTVAPDDDPFDPARPEAVACASAPRVVGRPRARQLRRLLGALVAPETGAPILGTHGPSIAYVDLDGTRPSLELLVVRRAPALAAHGDGVRCSLAWGGRVEVLPVLDPLACAAARAARTGPLEPGALARALGFAPGYVLAGLGPVRDGHVAKAVLALLPR